MFVKSYVEQLAEHNASVDAEVEKILLKIWRGEIDHVEAGRLLEYYAAPIDIVDGARKELAAVRQLHDAMKIDSMRYFERERPWPINTIPQFNYVKIKDAEFIATQRAKGHNVDELESKIADMQKSDADNVVWLEGKRRKAELAEADRQRKREDADQRRTIMQGNEARAIIREVFLEVFTHGK